MKRANGITLAATALALVTVASAQAQEQVQKVTDGGVKVPGWAAKIDATRENTGLTIADARFAKEGEAFKVTTGPAITYWSAANKATGNYTVKATFTEAKQTYNHPHPFGVFIGGSDLESGAANALYCAAYRNGNYIIRMFSGGKRVDVVGKPVPNDAVRKAAPEAEVVQEVAWTVKGDNVQCLVNGTAVWTGTRADLTGAGKLPSLDGIAGIRVSHNSDALVTNFAVTK